MFQPLFIDEARRCFIYCGDEQCLCGARPDPFLPNLPVLKPRKPEVSEVFLNERGSQIEVAAVSAPLDGVGGVQFRIAGPESSQDTHVTRREAQSIVRCLQEALK